MPPPLQVDNIFAFIRRQVAPVPACWIFETSATNLLRLFDLEIGVRVTCDVVYLCANFSLSRPLALFSTRVRPNTGQTDRQTDVSQKHRLMPPP